MVPLAALRRQFEVNVIGQVAVVQAFLPLLRAAGGRILNVGGAAGRMTLPMYGALSASKAALDSLSSALRMELKYQGVIVSYIEPGAVRTDFFGKSAQATREQGYAGNPRTLEIYAKAIAASAKGLAASPASSVSEVVDAMAEALTASQPAARYVVGRQARLGLRLLPKLPVGLRDRLLMSSLGLNSEVFKPGLPLSGYKRSSGGLG